MEEIKLNKKSLESYQQGVNDLKNFKEELKTKETDLINKFQKDNDVLIENITKLTEKLDIEKSQFKERAIDLFYETKQKKLIGGLGIREGINLIYEEDKAFFWAKEHSLCLSLNSREFEKIAKTQDIDFVSKENKITVTFPKEIVFDKEE